MLVKVSASCAGACRHCMENARPSKEHMTRDIFEATLDCSEQVERRARTVLGYKLLLFSGGEATDNPNVVEFLDLATKKGRFKPVLITHGAWITGTDERSRFLQREILKPDREILIQVTYDASYYPKAVPLVYDDPRICVISSVGVLLPLGRGKALVEKGESSKQIPTSFNFRSAVRRLGSVEAAVLLLRTASVAGKGWGNCVPSIDWQGTFRVGESNSCYPVGTVFSPTSVLTQNILAMGSCNRCGLEKNLQPEYKHAIGLE